MGLLLPSHAGSVTKSEFDTGSMIRSKSVGVGHRHTGGRSSPILIVPAAYIFFKMAIWMRIESSNSAFRRLPCGSNTGVLVAVKRKGFVNE